MLTYILESSVCLAIFLCFYKLLLEKENIHVFKRFYLLFAIALAFVIPLLTIPQYVEISTEIIPSIIENNPIQTNTQFETNTATHDNYFNIILWGIYGLGALITGLLFFKSLIQILFNIKNSSKLENDRFIIALLSNVVTPHTFFNYIFLNRYKFETQQIPQAVLLHEKTHALQKHSWDILCVELLQVIFWFNPLMYILKRDIKLNHEFLADQAVLSIGINTSSYQNILLAFSSNDQHPQLANAINYSSTKKRFIIMKKQTSKITGWLRSMLLLPILAFLLFSFSYEVIIVEKKVNTLESEDVLFQEIKATQKQIDEYNAIAKKYNAQPRAKRVITKKDEERLIYINNRLMTPAQKNKAENFPLFPLQHGIATQKQIAEYVALAKRYNVQRRSEREFKRKDLKRMEYIYGLLNTVQKRAIEPFPTLKTEKRTLQIQTAKNNASLVDNKRVDSNDLGKAAYFGHTVPVAKARGNIQGDVRANQIGNTSVVPPDVDLNVDPSVPKGFATSAITGLANKGAIFDYNGKQVSSERAISVAETTDFVVQRHPGSNKLIVYLSGSKPSKRQIKKRSKKY